MSNDCDYCRINELLNELGGLMVKRKCIRLAKQGHTREEINDMLHEELIPEFNAWMADMMRGFMHDEISAGETLN